MARPRVEAHRLQELVRLRRAGASARQVVRLLSMSPKTERRYRAALGQAGMLEGEPEELPTLDEIAGVIRQALPSPGGKRSTVEPWRSEVEALMDKGLGAQAIHDRLRLDTRGSARPFRVSYSAVKRFVRRVKRARGLHAGEVAVPVDTAPGEEAQVDFGYAGRLYDPKTGVVRRAWVFVMLLCHSRLMFVRLVFDQRTETWLDLHEQAFRHFGGVVGTVVPDNTKRAVLRAAFGVDGSSELERSYREFARAWGFKIDPAPPGEPRKRGKVESAVKYLRGNPLKGRDGEPMDEVQGSLQLWNAEVASVRVHGSTGRRPLDVFNAEERSTLRPLPAAPPQRAIWKQAKVHPDSHVTCRGRLFSVPWRLIQERVWVRACGRVVEVFHRDERVAIHEDRGLRRTTMDEHLPTDRRLLRHRGRAFWESRARKVGPETLALVVAVFDQDEVLSHLRAVQAIVQHLEQFPWIRAEAASRSAREVGDLTHRGVKRILSEGRDLAAAPVVERREVDARPRCRSCGSTTPTPRPASQADLRRTGS